MPQIEDLPRQTLSAVFHKTVQRVTRDEYQADVLREFGPAGVDHLNARIASEEGLVEAFRSRRRSIDTGVKTPEQEIDREIVTMACHAARYLGIERYTLK